MDLLKKIDKIEVKASDKIPQKDMEYLKTIESSYWNTVNQLKDSIISLQKLVEENENGIENLYNVKSDYYKNKKYHFEKKSIPSDKQTIFNSYAFSFQEPIAQCMNNLEKAKDSFIRIIISYFNKVYSLKIEGEIFSDSVKINGWDKRETVELEEVIDYVLSQCNGIDLKQAGINLLIKEFSELVEKRHVSDHIKISKLTISFSDFMYYDTWLNDRPKLRWDDKRYWQFLRAIIYFDSDLTEAYCFNRKLPGFHNNMEFVFEPIEMNGQKIDSIKFFKNRKVEIKFTSQEHVSNFVKMFNIVC